METTSPAPTAEARSPRTSRDDLLERFMVVLLVLAVLAIAAWTYDRVSGSSGDAPSPAAALEASARAFAASTVAQDWDAAYGAMTVECQARKTRAQFEADVQAGMDMAETMGLDLTKVVITDVQVRDVTETSGEVLTVGEVDGARLTDEEVWDTWVYQEGSWRSTDCPDNGDPQAADQPPVATDPAAVPAAG